MKKRFLFIFALVLFAPSIANACSCIPPEPPLEAKERAAAVFAGRVESIEQSDWLMQGGADPVIVRMTVSDVWKGPENQNVTIRTARDSAACGYSFEEGKAYLVYAHESDNGLATGICERTALLSDAEEDVKELGEAIEPASSEEPISARGKEEYLAVSILVLVIAGAFLFWVRSRRA